MLTTAFISLLGKLAKEAIENWPEVEELANQIKLVVGPEDQDKLRQALILARSNSDDAHAELQALTKG